MLFTKLASHIRAQIADLSPWHDISLFFGQDLNQIFTLQSTQVSSKLILASWKRSKVMQLPARESWTRFHAGVGLMAAFPRVLSIGNDILLTWGLKLPYSNARSIFIWQLQVYERAAEKNSSLLSPTWLMCVVEISQVWMWPSFSHWTQYFGARLMTLVMYVCRVFTETGK